MPVELFGSVEFPRIGDEPYMVSLGPHSFLWFRLATDPVAADPHSSIDLPELAWRGDLCARLKRPSDEVADVLLRWTISRRWYRGGTHPVASARISDVVELPSSPPAVLAFLHVAYRDAEPATYVLPLATDVEFDADDLVAEAPEAAIARLVGEGETARLLDGTLRPRRLRGAARRGLRAPAHQGRARLPRGPCRQGAARATGGPGSRSAHGDAGA